MEEENIYRDAIAKWGFELQINQAIQEMAELTVELTKIFQEKRTNFDKIFEEMVDVEIMMNQLKYMFKTRFNEDFENKYANMMANKLIIVKKKIEGEYYGSK